jgi:DNA polymerase I
MPTVAAGTFSMNCLSGDTNVITLDGIKNIKNVNIGDYVISKNMTNGNTEWKLVKNKFSSRPEKTYSIKGRSIDFITTGNHKLIIKKRDGKRKNNIGYKNEYQFETVVDLFSQSHKLKARRKLPDFSEIENSPNVICNYPIFSIDGASILGWFISEGNTRDYLKYPSDNSIGIGQRKCIHPKNYEEITNLIIRLGYNPYFSPDKICFINKILKHYFIKNVGRLCHEKKIPKECFAWPLEMRKSLWDAMMKGDGDKKNTTYTTTSYQLQQDFSILSMTLGIGVTLSKGIIQKSDKHHTLYQVYLRKVKGNLLYTHNISEHDKQETYCIEIEDNHNFVAGRNGKFQFIGNCGYFGTPCIGNEKIDTQSRLFPELSVDVNDIHTARNFAIQLKKDKDFYEYTSYYAKKASVDSLYCNTNKWLSHMKGILNE